MPPTTRKKRRPYAKPKIALVSVLAMVLAGVWGRVLIGGGKHSGRSSIETRRKTGPVAAPVAETAREQPNRRPAAEWAEVPLAEAVLNDPFAKPAWAAPPKPAPGRATPEASPPSGRAAAKENLRARGASMILVGAGGKIAVVGDREVRVGDTIDGFEVLDITTTGVILSDTRTNARSEAASGAPPPGGGRMPQ